jgi:hypothetical protein
MKILNLARKGTFMNILEMRHMYNISKQGLQIDEKLPDYTNPIYDILLQTYPTQPHYAHSAPPPLPTHSSPSARIQSTSSNTVAM